jgi:4-amino-4-deoxy-L-arabinose transferase-like glycosyltransferase
MSWLESLDLAGFRFLNQDISHPALDWLMPFLSSNPFFAPALAALAAGLLWKGGVRGRVCVAMLLLLVGVVNNGAVEGLKHLCARPRPFLELDYVRELVGRGGSFSLPSSHTANWFAGAAVAFVYYRHSLRIMLPLAALVGLSRIYVGVHYPSDVLAGALLGSILGWGGVRTIAGLWRTAGARLFPLWWRHLPSLRKPAWHPDPLLFQPGLPPVKNPELTGQRQWLRLSYLLIAGLLLARLAYLGAGKIELSEDEAYQWLWSKHLDLSYYSKPPLIACAQFLGTSLWGDTEFGVRFCAPVIGALVGFMLVRFVSREFNARVAFLLLLVVTATPLMAGGSILMTIDSLAVLFWTAAMVAGWRAVQREGRPRDWLWTGWWMGLGFLSKYISPLQWLAFAVFFCLWPASRQQLRRPGPYLALAVNLLCAVPVLLWNAQHDWISMSHLHDRAGLTGGWQPTLKYSLDFTLAEAGLLNPVFFVGIIWAVAAVWRRRRQDPLLLYLLSMGAPLFGIYWLYTLRARVHPNWIAPSVLPLLCLMTVYGESRWRAGVAAMRRWLIAGLSLGLPAVILLHDTNLVAKMCGQPLPAAVDPLRRVRGWSEAARLVEQARQDLLQEGKPVFVIGNHYGITSLLSFYLPEGKLRVSLLPLVYCLSSDRPVNQFYFWPGYGSRKGQNAVFVQICKTPEPAPARLQHEFAIVTDLGMRQVAYRGRVLRTLQLYACRDLR